MVMEFGLIASLLVLNMPLLILQDLKHHMMVCIGIHLLQKARNNVAAMLPFAAQVAAANCRALGARTGLPLRSDPCLASFLHQSSKVRVTSLAT
ncbi:hypothetical protein I3760_16G014500 [Carya illinoinensis]|nr:hypothetical protein I3760_16G014500 [Carya illinoinensis]